jgi:hypothetical protein
VWQGGALLNVRIASASILVAGLFYPSALTAQTMNGADLAIRVYNVFRVPAHQIRSAHRTATAIFEKAGVRLAAWRECRIDSVSCTEPLHSNEVVMRIIPTPAAWANPGALGFSYVPAPTPSWLSTVFADHIAEVATRSGIEAGMLLGRAVAHEVGHLLLGSASHSEGGLMRANWADSSLKRNLPVDWLFSPREASRMRADVIARSRATRDVLADLATTEDLMPFVAAAEDGLSPR